MTHKRKRKGAAAAPREATKLAIGYVRVSTQEQAAHGVSLEVQEDRIRAYCKYHGLELLTIVCDAGVSGTVPIMDRPNANKITGALAGEKVQHVVALKLDRMFRNAEDCLTSVRMFDRHGVALHLVDLGGQALDTTTAMGRFFLTMMAGFAEMERNLISERTTAALRHRIAQGQRFGQPRLGFRTTNPKTRADIIPSEFSLALEIIALRESGLSYRAIVNVLNEKGYKSRRGIWHPSAPRHVWVAREIYARAQRMLDGDDAVVLTA